LFIDTNYRLSYCSALIMAHLGTSIHADRIRMKLLVVKPPFVPSYDIPCDQSWNDRSVRDWDGKVHTTQIIRMGPQCQIAVACVCKALLNHIRYDSNGDERRGDEEDEDEDGDEEDGDKEDGRNKKNIAEIVQFLEAMIEMCDYGVCICSSGDSNKRRIYRKFMSECDYGITNPPLHALQYIKYSGPVDVRAVRQVSAFLQGDGEGDLPTIDCLKKAILTMCAINDAKWSIDDGCDYLTPTGIFDPTHLEICVEADKGMGNGGMEPDEYFNVLYGTCGTQHP
jgi:hypothetical protein